MIKILNYFGLFVKEDGVLPYSYTTGEYTSTISENIRMHRDFLKSIEAEENNRLNLIESKTSQIISQTGVTFALLSLFIPIFTDKISDQNFIVKTIFILILIISYLFYALTIHNAIKNFNIKKFVYGKSSPINVIKYIPLDI